MENRYYKLVVCRNPECRREYICLPDDYYYDASPESTTDGLCKNCFMPKVGKMIVMKTVNPLKKKTT